MDNNDLVAVDQRVEVGEIDDVTTRHEFEKTDGIPKYRTVR